MDSFFWGRTIWPEGSSLLFNVVDGQSANWGVSHPLLLPLAPLLTLCLQVSPFHHYFTSALPKLLNFALPLALGATLIDGRARALGFPALAFVALLSCLGHKEWRFIVYVVPSLHVCAAAGAQSLGVL